VDVDVVAMDRQKNERELYERFLRGEEISDDDEDAVLNDVDDLGYEYGVEDEDGSESTSEIEDGDDAGSSMEVSRAGSVFREGERQERQEEAIALFTDLVRTQGVDEGSRLVWGHLARTTGRENVLAPPLTRRRWCEMGRRWGLGFSDDLNEDVWEVDVGPSGLMGADGDGTESEVDWTDRAMCIICTGRPRDIVSWPCR
jgi:hypothetical protein